MNATVLFWAALAVGFVYTLVIAVFAYMLGVKRAMRNMSAQLEIARVQGRAAGVHWARDELNRKVAAHQKFIDESPWL